MDWLFNLFGTIGGYVNNALAFLSTIISWLLAAVTFLANAVVELATYIKNAVNSLIQFIKNLWSGGFGNIFTRLFKWLKQQADALERKLKPIIDHIKDLRAWWDRYYRLHVLPMIQMIQRIRRFLLILRMLHIHIADKLDAWLAKYEAAINKVNLAVHGTLNQIIDWLNLASNPFGLGRMVLVSIATRRTAAATIRVVTGLPIGHFFPSNSPNAFAFERQPQSSKDYTSETTNPPASQIMLPLLSFLGTGEFDDQVGATDQDIDAIEPNPWGGELVSNLIAGEKFLADYSADALSIRVMLEDRVGLLHDTGIYLGQSLAKVWT